MSELFSKIFRYIPKETNFKLFGFAHFLSIVGIAALVIIMCLIFRNKSKEVKQKVLNITAISLTVLYIFDFFVQPFWAGNMSVHKLPFHICTATGVLIPFVTFNKKFDFLKIPVTVWAIVAPTLWIFIPSNVFDGFSHLYSYPIMQSYIYHIVEVFWGIFMITSATTKLSWKTLWQPIVGLIPLAIWATIGQELYYPNTIGENFMFLRTEVTIVPHWVFLIALFTAASLVISLVYLICNCVIKKNKEISKEIDVSVI